MKDQVMRKEKSWLYTIFVDRSFRCLLQVLFAASSSKAHIKVEITVTKFCDPSWMDWKGQFAVLVATDCGWLDDDATVFWGTVTALSSPLAGSKNSLCDNIG